MIKFAKFIQNKKKIILFDLDGVLIDSISNMKLSWETCCKEFSINNSFDEYRKFIGIPFDDILKKLKITKKKDLIKKKYRVVSNKNLSKIKLYKNTKKTLYFLSNYYTLGIVTSKEKKRTDIILRKLKILKYFSVIVNPSLKLKGKPYPDQLLHALKKMKIKKKNAVYIGDVKYDQIAAKNAGIKF